jgi:hypothetical protein
MLRLLTAPCGTQVPLHRSVIHDPAESVPQGNDAVLLLVGLAPDELTTEQVVHRAATLGYRAVTIKRRGRELDSVIQAAQAAGIAVLLTPDEAAWRQVDALISAAIGAPVADEDPGDTAGDELFALANAVAAVIGGSVAIEDLEQRVLAYSSLPGQRMDELRRRGILDRRVPDLPGQSEQYRSTLNAPGVVRFSVLGPDELPRAAVAVRAGDVPLGTIWAIEGQTPLDANGERALLDGARVATLHLLRRRSAGDLELQVRDESLRTALEGRSENERTRLRLHLPDRPTLTLLGFASTPSTANPSTANSDDTAPPVTRTGRAIARYWAAIRPDASVTTASQTVYVLLPHGTLATARRLAEQTLTATARTIGVALRAAVSRHSVDPGELPALRSEVDDVLRVGIADSRSPAVAELSEVHAQVLLARVADDLVRHPRLRHPGVEAMTDHDRSRRTAYAASITAWMDALGNVTEAAQRLGVHPNTLKYRLRRARELFGLDLDDPDERLSCWIQLRLVAGLHPPGNESG